MCKAFPESVSNSSSSHALWRDFAIVVGLTVAIQFALYFQSFLGRTVLLPVQILDIPGIYATRNLDNRPTPNWSRADLIQVAEPHRWFMAREYRAGRIPLWMPHRFAGTPFARAPLFSPFELLYVGWPDPRVLPWIQLSAAIVAATGCWKLASRLFGLQSPASIIAGVAYPLTGFQVIWQGYDLVYPVAFFPWEVLAAR